MKYREVSDDSIASFVSIEGYIVLEDITGGANYDVKSINKEGKRVKKKHKKKNRTPITTQNRIAAWTALFCVTLKTLSYAYYSQTLNALMRFIQTFLLVNKWGVLVRSQDIKKLTVEP